MENKTLSKKEEGKEILENLMLTHLYDFCDFGKYRGEDFWIIAGWQEIEGFMYDLVANICGQEIIDKYYSDKLSNRCTGIEYGDLRIDMSEDKNNSYHFVVPEEVLDGLREYGLIDEDCEYPELDDILDAQTGFSDEYAVCDECRDVVRTSPGSYGWTPDHEVIDCEIFCGDCIRQYEDLTETYIDTLVNNPTRANTILESEHLRNFGFLPLCEAEERSICSFNSGWYESNDNHDPKSQLIDLNERYQDVIFDLTSVGQFETNWQIWVKNAMYISEEELFDEKEIEA